MARTSRKQVKNLQEDKAELMKIGLYVRLSDEDNGGAGKDSIKNQKELLIEFAHRIEQSKTVEIYVDNGHTGTDFARPEWERMMEDIKKHKINCVIVKDLSRFARNYLEAGDYLEKIFPFLEVRFIAVNDQYDSVNQMFPEKDLIAEFKNLANDYYSRDISRKVMSAFKVKKTQGEFIGNKAPYGYVLKNNHFLVDGSATSVVRRIFRMKLQGRSSHEIARILNQENIPSPGRYAFEHREKRYKNSGNVAWQPQAINRILYNRVYVGDLVQGKYNLSIYSKEHRGKKREEMWEIRENAHEAIVDKDVFLQVQEIKNRNRKAWRDKQGGDAYDNILKGILVCGICKHPLRRNKDTRNKKVRYYFYCASSYNYTQTDCSASSIVDHKLFNIILEQIKLQIDLAIKVEDLLIRLKQTERNSDRYRGKKDELKQIQDELKRTTYLKANLYGDLKQGILTKQEFLIAKEKYALDIEVLTEKLRKQQKELETFERCMSGENKWLKVFLSFRNAKELTKDMAQALLERVEVYEDKRIHIIYRFRNEYEYLISQLKDTEEAYGE